jgi:hypothetical protein
MVEGSYKENWFCLKAFTGRYQQRDYLGDVGIDWWYINTSCVTKIYQGL